MSVGDMESDGDVDSLVYQTKQAGEHQWTNVVDLNLDGQNDMKVTWDKETGKRHSTEVWFQGEWHISYGEVGEKTVEIDGKKVHIEFGDAVGWERSNNAVE